MKYAGRLLGLLFILMSGCVVEPAPPYPVVQTIPGGLTIEEVLRMSKAGLSDQAIIERIKSDGVAARPTSDQTISLKGEGVSEPVLEAMLSARVAPEQKVVRYAYPSSYYYYGYPYYGYPYYWRYYPYYWYGYPYWHGWYGYWGWPYSGGVHYVHP